MKTDTHTRPVKPHPQSRASLLALNENLRNEALSRKRAMADIEFKREFEQVWQREWTEREEGDSD